MRHVALGILLLGLLPGTVEASPDLPNRLLLRVASEDPSPPVSQVAVQLRFRLRRFGLPAETSVTKEGLLRVDLPPLDADRAPRIRRLLLSPGRVEIRTASGGEVVVPSDAVRGIESGLEEGRVVFRFRLAPEARRRFEESPAALVFRWDGRDLLWFARRGSRPEVTFPAAYPREDLRVLFCTVFHGPLAAPLEVVEEKLDAVADPALAWRTLVKGWFLVRPDRTGTRTFLRPSDQGKFVAETRVVEREGKACYLLRDRLEVPGHPERSMRSEIFCRPDWSLIEGRLWHGGQVVELDPDDVFLAPGVVLRVATLLPPVTDAAYGPGGRLRVRRGERAGTLEIEAPGRPAAVLREKGRVTGLRLDPGGEIFLRVANR
jgi:hypothetical protein